MSDSYKTILKPVIGEVFRDKGSKFIAYAYPLNSEKDVKTILEDLKLQHPKARHFCYAWQLGHDKLSYKVNDDGEPSNSAGQPIYGQILSKDLSDIVVIVVRYFGGVKLGVGGLVNAYKQAAFLALDRSKKVVRTIDVQYKLSFEYAALDKVMRYVKKNKLQITEKKTGMYCEFILRVRKNDTAAVKNFFQEAKNIQLIEL